MSVALEDSLREIRIGFVDALAQRLATVQSAITTLELDHPDETKVEDAQAVLHKIAGTAAPLGFREFGEKSRACEEEIDIFLLGDTRIRERIIANLKSVLEIATIILQESQSTNGVHLERKIR